MGVRSAALAAAGRKKARVQRFSRGRAAGRHPLRSPRRRRRSRRCRGSRCGTPSRSPQLGDVLRGDDRPASLHLRLNRLGELEIVHAQAPGLVAAGWPTRVETRVEQAVDVCEAVLVIARVLHDTEEQRQVQGQHTGIAELAWVTTAFRTATRASPSSGATRSRIAAAARSRSSLALPSVACQ